FSLYYSLSLLDLHTFPSRRSSDLGIAGYDLTNLHFWMVTKEDKYLNEAIKIGNELIEKRTKNQSGCFWPSPEGTVFIGYLNCSSGIALFLLYLYQVTNERLS